MAKDYAKEQDTVQKRNEYWLTDKGLAVVAYWARKGYSREQIAENMGIDRKTLYQWQNNFSNFSDALNSRDELILAEAEAGLRDLLSKHVLKTTTRTQTIDKEGNPVEVVSVTEREVDANMNALKFYLANRDGERWKNTPENEDPSLAMPNITVVYGRDKALESDAEQKV